MHVKLEPTKTYASIENAEAAVARHGLDELRYFILLADNGRCFPAFTLNQLPTPGNPQALNALTLGVHNYFCVIG